MIGSFEGTQRAPILRRSRHVWIGALLAALPASSSAQPASVSQDLRWLPLRRPILAQAIPPGAWIEVWEDSLLAAASGPDFSGVRIGGEDGRVLPHARREPSLLEPHLETVEAAAPWTLQDGDRMRIWDLGGSNEALTVTIDRPEAARRALLSVSRNRESWDLANWEPAEPGFHAAQRPPGARDPTVRPRVRPPVRPKVPPEEVRTRRVWPAERYFRIVLPAGSLPADEVPSVTVERIVLLPAPRVEVDWKLRDARYHGREWVEHVGIDGPPRALSGVVFDLPARPMRLPVAVEVRTVDGAWMQVAAADLRSDAQESRGVDDELRRLEWEPVRAGELRIRVSGGDPPHDPVDLAAVEAVPFRFALPPAGGSPEGATFVPGGLWLYFGDPHLAPEGADLEPLLPGVPEIVRAALGASQPNPFHQPPGFGLEWLRRRPWAVTAAMAGVLLALVVIVLRRRPDPSSINNRG